MVKYIFTFPAPLDAVYQVLMFSISIFQLSSGIKLCILYLPQQMFQELIPTRADVKGTHLTSSRCSRNSSHLEQMFQELIPHRYKLYNNYYYFLLQCINSVTHTLFLQNNYNIFISKIISLFPRCSKSVSSNIVYSQFYVRLWNIHMQRVSVVGIFTCS